MVRPQQIEVVRRLERFRHSHADARKRLPVECDRVGAGPFLVVHDHHAERREAKTAGRGGVLPLAAGG